MAPSGSPASTPAVSQASPGWFRSRSGSDSSRILAAAAASADPRSARRLAIDGPVGRRRRLEFVEKALAGGLGAVAHLVAKPRPGARRQDPGVFSGAVPPRGPAVGRQDAVKRRLDGGDIARSRQAFQDLNQRLARLVDDKGGEGLRVLDLAAAEVAFGEWAQVSVGGSEGNRNRAFPVDVDLDVFELQIEVDHATDALSDDLDDRSHVMIEPPLDRLEFLEGPPGGRDGVAIEHRAERGAALAVAGEIGDQPLEQRRRRLGLRQPDQLADRLERVAGRVRALQRLGQQLEQGPGQVLAPGLPGAASDLEELAGWNRLLLESLQARSPRRDSSPAFREPRKMTT